MADARNNSVPPEQKPNSLWRWCTVVFIVLWLAVGFFITVQAAKGPTSSCCLLDTCDVSLLSDHTSSSSSNSDEGGSRSTINQGVVLPQSNRSSPICAYTRAQFAAMGCEDSSDLVATVSSGKQKLPSNYTNLQSRCHIGTSRYNWMFIALAVSILCVIVHLATFILWRPHSSLQSFFHSLVGGLAFVMAVACVTVIGMFVGQPFHILPFDDREFQRENPTFFVPDTTPELKILVQLRDADAIVTAVAIVAAFFIILIVQLVLQVVRRETSSSDAGATISEVPLLQTNPLDDGVPLSIDTQNTTIKILEAP